METYYNVILVIGNHGCIKAVIGFDRQIFIQYNERSTPKDLIPTVQQGFKLKLQSFTLRVFIKSTLQANMTTEFILETLQLTVREKRSVPSQSHRLIE